ncbi:MAG: tRNA (adenosine(37)-N6)-threonylcarbamoyltransferase complex transferase subunit TsaD [Anaerolineaceae bacterium]|nr:tRNA (adenosine(37)-N6)-threonylcarbamoyltransferase complex transferase subunit TsaD [Anaerolineaceae bacterium]MDD4043717.1 tRNA (adenosine(37)-N6)-threonylcarbamoyltransferase complex transferase subunit TsaD [Anaerolineaceae bacterium]MDD4578405.1 tRNA (adenosine(37)-N6)-threonylcarbamoyltransferase complex transferase subunit TsaD [Anaerolineaceae bacterium]
MKNDFLRVLGIESSCDETAAAIVEGGRVILSSVIASQVDLHAQFGGVYPELASREHVRAIHAVVNEALQQAHMQMGDLDAIAVTRGPGLAGSLVVGVNMAKALALSAELPIIGVNHLEGHLYSAWLYPADSKAGPEPEFPLVALLVSGGHTELILMKGHLDYETLGNTADDAAGEAFDKVARLLDLAYPGGPSIQKAAQTGNPRAFNFPKARLDSPWDFSFSGLKTAVLRKVEDYKNTNKKLPVADIAASFQQAVVETLYEKTIAAAEEYKAKDIIVAGGVSANRALREAFRVQTRFRVHIPHINLCTDNAAMIAAAAYRHLVIGQTDPLDFDVQPNWSLVKKD